MPQGLVIPDGSHLEFCLLSHQPPPYNDCQNGWQHPRPTTYDLKTNVNGQYPVYAVYALVSGGNYQISPYGSDTITLNTTKPKVALNSPAGLLNPATGAWQTQSLNSAAAQAVTYLAGSPVGESVTVTPFGCGQSGSCTQLTQDSLPVPPYLWAWSGASPASGYAYLRLRAMDEAGNTRTTPTPDPGPSPTPPIALFDPSAGPLGVTCTYATCTILADQQPNEIIGDDPSGTETACNGPDPKPTIAFSGYADPSMRRDPLISTTNPWGANLWMLYSYPKYKDVVTDTVCYHTGVVETHLANSNSTTVPNGGATWQASGAIWPSETFTGGCGILNYSGQCYSSHEVPNFWPNSDGQTETWYAVHLMYFVPPNGSIAYNIQFGCLVLSITTAGTPTALGWSSGGPSTCGGNFPPGDLTKTTALHYSTLNDLVVDHPTLDGNPCLSWGEPAIMVASAPPGQSGNAVYLATSCFDLYFQSQGYYVFYSLISATDPTSLSAWTYYSGPFSYLDLPDNSFPKDVPNQPNSLTELDWAVRPDGGGNIVAVITPSYVLGESGTGTPRQFGCAAVTFSLSDGFGSLIATVDDSYGSTGIYEMQGANGCTYEPASNTGIVIVRHLMNSGLGPPYYNPLQYQLYSLIDTGVLP